MANHSPGEELYKTSMEASAEDAGRPRSMELVTGGADSSLRQHYGRRRQCTSLPSETLSHVEGGGGGRGGRGGGGVLGLC